MSHFTCSGSIPGLTVTCPSMSSISKNRINLSGVLCAKWGFEVAFTQSSGSISLYPCIKTPRYRRIGMVLLMPYGDCRQNRSRAYILVTISTSCVDAVCCLSSRVWFAFNATPRRVFLLECTAIERKFRCYFFPNILSIF